LSLLKCFSVGLLFGFCQTTSSQMSGRQGGKLKPLKAAKKEKKEEDEDDIAFKAKQKADTEALKKAQEKAKQGGPMGGAGIKKSGKK